MTRVLGSFWLWTGALLVVTVAAFVAAPAAGESAQRIAHLESIVRCPACEDLSVAQSDAASSIAVRHEIVRRVHLGQSDTTILTAIEDQYGPAILLSPDAGGFGDLLWIVPIIIFAGGLGLYVRLARRRA